jgi:uroporphyrinogen decarboxylase
MLSALTRNLPDTIPTFEWFIDTQVGEALTGFRDPIDIVDALDIDGINIRPDYSRQQIKADLFADEWGAVRQDTGDSIPAILKSPIQDIRHHEAYTFPDVEAGTRFVSLARARERFGDTRAVILNLRDGFSDMRDLLGYENALMDMLAEPGHFKTLLNRSVDYNLALAARAKREFGIDIVATTDDIATAHGLLMRPETYFEVIGPAFRRVMQGYRDLGLHVIKHCDGDCSAVIDFWINCGINCLDPIDPGAGFDMEEFKARYGDRICLKGNIDCKGALQYGTVQDVEAEVRTCIQKTGARTQGGLILSSSNTIHSGVNPKNYQAMLAALRQYGQCDNTKTA